MNVAKEVTKTIELTEVQAKDLADFISWDLFYQIREDTEIDSIEWLCSMCDLYKALNEVAEQFKRERERREVNV